MNKFRKTSLDRRIKRQRGQSPATPISTANVVDLGRARRGQSFGKDSPHIARDKYESGDLVINGRIMGKLL